VLFILIETQSAMTPAISISKLLVKSMCRMLRASGRNSARAMAPSEDRSVPFKKTRLRLELKVMALRRAVIYITASVYECGAGRGGTHSFQCGSTTRIEGHVEGLQRRVVFLGNIKSVFMDMQRCRR
jgi:hypothetical protein